MQTSVKRVADPAQFCELHFFYYYVCPAPLRKAVRRRRQECDSKSAAVGRRRNANILATRWQDDTRTAKHNITQPLYHRLHPQTKKEKEQTLCEFAP